MYVYIYILQEIYRNIETYMYIYIFRIMLTVVTRNMEVSVMEIAQQLDCLWMTYTLFQETSICGDGGIMYHLPSGKLA